MKDSEEPALVVLLLAAFLLAVPCAAQKSFELERVSESVYAVRRSFVGSNAALVVLEGEVLVVDTHASPAAARDLLRAVRELSTKPVRYVVNTHWHTDHMLGNEAYFEAFGDGLEFLSHHTARDDMQELAQGQLPVTLRFLGDDLERARAVLDEHTGGEAEQRERFRLFVEDLEATLPAMEGMGLTLPTLTFERELRLHRPGQGVHLLYFGEGHTRGDVVVYLPQEKVVVTGDLLTHPTLYVGQSSHPVEWVDALKALAELDFEHAVPGHGGVISGKGYLRMVTAMLEEVVRQVRAAVDSGKKFQEATESVDLGELRRSLTAGDAEKESAFDKAAGFVEDAAQRAYLDVTGRLPHDD